jgi:thiol-disulfide isomerase/thioredoxin
MRLVPLVLLVAALASGSDLSLPGCEARPEVRQVLERDLDWEKLDQMKVAERDALTERVLGELAAKYPREAVPRERLIDSARWDNPERLPEVQERYGKTASANPDDPLASYLAAYALWRTDTPRTIQLAEKARKLATDFPAPLLLLTRIYMSGKFVDKPKAASLLSRYFDLCPASTAAGWEMNKVGTPELRARVAGALRAKLEKETDPAELLPYEDLWGLEFRVRPPAEHAALRKQVAADVARLEKLNPKPDKRYFKVLRIGYKQNGASKEAIAALNDRIAREAPGTQLAYRVEHERWEEANKPPEDQKDLAAWRAYNAKMMAFQKQMAQRFPSVARTIPETEFYAIGDDPDTPAKDVLAALDRYLGTFDYERPYMGSYLGPANVLLNRKLEPARAMALLRKAIPLLEREEARRLRNDALDDSDRSEQEKDSQQARAGLRHSMVKAALLMDDAEAIAGLKGEIEGAPPAEKSDLSAYWQDRARLALLDRRRADALAYYQTAFETRSEPPRWREGRLIDDLTDEAKSLWKELGGTDVAYSHWIAPPAGAKTEAAGSEWKRPTKELPQSELADISGKTWKLKQLEGKAVLINLWATWCGPCQRELPKLQQLYETVKDRSDVQVLTFNIDDDAGLVAPFVAEKKYTFPVLLANDVVNKLYDGWAIPQNWLIDPAGKWRWVEIGYDSAEPDWVGSMLKRVEELKKPDKTD